MDLENLQKFMENLYFLLQKAVDLSKDDLLGDILQDLNAKVGNVCCMYLWGGGYKQGILFCNCTTVS